ncbi:hypothetical protein [Actinopolymorpha alba]|uniref:hypothetical protein n=1 Tax=Actinopolymorpha alba TaxID=533267 RepID=UPI0012F6DC9F|nr:hypothetical protein [Actinopolymorpha alba]
MSPNTALDRPSEPERIDAQLLKLGGVLVLGALTPMLDTTIVNVGVERRSRNQPVAT